MIKERLMFFAFLTVLIVSAEATVITHTDKKVTAHPDDAADLQLLYVKANAGLLQVASTRYEITAEFLHGEAALAVDYHHPRDRLYWSTAAGEIYSCALRDSRRLAYVGDVTLLHSEAKWYPADIAVDYRGDKLYVLDTRTNTLRVLDIGKKIKDGKREMIVLGVGARNYKPSQVLLDPSEGYVFLMDDGESGYSRSGHILRMNMDGSQALFIDPPSFSKEAMTGKIGLDRHAKMILVSSQAQNKIFGIDYTGKVLGTILEPQNGTLSMSATKSELFWVNKAYYRQGVSFIDGSVYKCDYDGRSCLPGTTRKLHEGYSGGHVKALNVVVEPPSPPGDQQQHLDNKTAGICRECQQLCLPSKSAAGAQCVCGTGWRATRGDSRRCERIEEFLIIENAKVARGVCPGAGGAEGNRCEAIEPLEVELRFRDNEQTGFDYDSLTRKLYYGGKDSLYRVDVDSGARARLLYQKDVFFGPLALDWVSKNLYYTEIERRGNVSFYILKAMSASGEDAKRAHLSTSLLWELGRVHSLAVHPYRGYLFASVFNNARKRYQLLRLTTDARNITLLSSLGETTFLSIDYLNDELYVLDANTSLVTRSNLDGGQAERLFDASDIRNVTGFLVHDRHIYVKNRTTIRRFDKSTGKRLDELRLDPYDREMTANLRLHSPGKVFRLDASGNPCAVGNGGCENFCFAVPGADGGKDGLRKVCKCYDGVKCGTTG